MDWMIVAGATCLGILIGAIVAWYFSAAQETGLTVPVLLGAISAIAGSSVLAMFSFLAGLKGPTSEYWFYPVGLLAGFTAIMCAEYIHYDYYGRPRKRFHNRQ